MSLILICLDFLNISTLKEKAGDWLTIKVSDIHISPYNNFPPKAMDSPSMLYIQEDKSLNSARIVRVPTLHKALDGKVSIIQRW